MEQAVPSAAPAPSPDAPAAAARTNELGSKREKRRRNSFLEPQPDPTGYIIHPTDSRKATWDNVVMLLVVYFAVTAPIRIGFDVEAEGWMWWLEAAMTIAFMIDVYLSFRTAYLDRGEWVIEPAKVRRNYLKFWFWIDVCSRRATPIQPCGLLL